MRYDFIVKVLNQLTFDLIPVGNFCVEKVLILDTIWSLIEQLRLFIIILDCLSKSSE